MNMSNYKDSANVMKLNGNRNYCAPLALSLVTGHDIEEVNAYVLRSGLRRSKVSGMTTPNMMTYLNNHLINHEEIEFNGDPKGTISTIGRRYPRGVFLVFVRGHVAAMIDGEVLDWTAGRRHRVIKLVRIDGTLQTRFDVPAKPRIVIDDSAPKKKLSKSQQMLVMVEGGMVLTVDEMAEVLATSAASVRCYVNYFNGGKRGHQQVSMYVMSGIIVLGAR